MIRSRVLPTLLLLLSACGGGEGPSEPSSDDSPPPVPGTWRSLADMPFPVAFAGGAVHMGRIYVVGGSMVNGALRYDPGTNAWERLPDLPGEVHAAAVRNDTLLVVGSSAIYAWSEVERKWDAYGQLPLWGQFPLVQGHAAGLLATRLGFEGVAPADSAFLLPPGTSNWQEIPPVPFQGQTARVQGLSADATGIWAIGLESIARYSPATGQWETSVPTGSTSRFGCGVATPTRVHHFTWPGNLRVHEALDIASKAWSPAAPIPDASQNWGPLCLSIGERVYVIGGDSGGGLNVVATVRVFEY